MANLKLDILLNPTVDSAGLNASASKMTAAVDAIGGSFAGSNAKAKEFTDTLNSGATKSAGAVDALGNELENVGDVLDKTGKKGGSAFSGISSAFKEGQAQAATSTGIFGQAANSIGQIATPAGAATAAIGAVGVAFAATLSIGQKFQTDLQAVSAVTGVTGAALDDIANRAQAGAAKFGGSASEQLGVFQTTLSKIGPQLANDADALSTFADNVNLLSKTDSALGAAGAVDALTGSMLQFGVDVNNSNEVARESGRFINILAASAAVGSASVSQVADTFAKSGATLKNANLSVEESAAAVQVLASKSLLGSEAGTGLTAVVNKLQAASGPAAEKLLAMGTSSKKLGEILTTQGLGAAMDELRTGMSTLGGVAEKNAFLVELFGEGGTNAAAALLGGGDMLKQFTEGVTGTNAATEQAAINMNTLSEQFSRGQAAVENFAIDAFKILAPILSSTIGAIGTAFDTVKGFLSSNAEPIKIFLSVLAIGAVSVAGAMYGALIPSVIASASSFVVMGVSAAAAWLAAAAPIIAVVAGIAAVGAAIIYAYNTFEGFRNLIVTIKDIGTAVFEGLVQYAVDYWNILKAVGEVIFNVLILPFKLAYAVISPLISLIFDFGKSLFGVTDSAKSGGGAIEFITNAFGVLHTIMGTVLAGIKAVTAGIAIFAETATTVIDKILHLDFAGAVDAAKDGGKKMGEATAATFGEGLQNLKTENAAKRFEKDFTTAQKAIEDSLKNGLEVKTKLSAIDDVTKLQTSLEATQAKLKPLEVKVAAGQKLTPEEQKSFDDLAKKAAEVSGKIKDVAPEAIKGVKTLVGSNGELIQSYEVNKTKLGEVAAKNKEAFGAEQVASQKKFSDSITSLSALYDGQKAKLAEVKKAIDAANAKGDTAGATKLAEEFKILSAEASKTGKELESSFKKGAEAGLLTNDATVKVGASLGVSAAKAGDLAKQLASAAVEAAKITIDTKKLGDAFDAAKKKNDEALSSSQLQARGVKDAYDTLSKALKSAGTDQEKRTAALAAFNAASGSSVKTELEAKELLKKSAKDLQTKQNEAEAEGLRLTKITQSTSNEFKRSEAVKTAQNVLKTTTDAIEATRQLEEKAARDKVRTGKQIELDLAVELIEIQKKADLAKLDAQRVQLETVKKNHFGATKAEQDADMAAIAAITTAKSKVEIDTETKIQSEKTKARLKEYDEAQKRIADDLKLESEFAKKTVELTEKRVTDTSEKEKKRLVDLNAAKITALQTSNKLEIAEHLAKDATVLAAETALRDAIGKGNEQSIQFARTAALEAQAAALTNNANILSANKSLNDAIIEQNKQAAFVLQDFEIANIKDKYERERAAGLLAVERNLAAELLAARGNERLKTEALDKALTERAALQEKYFQATSTAYSLAAKIQLNIEKQFSNDAIAERKRVAKEADTELKKSEDSLFTLLKNRTLSEKDYYGAVSDLERKRAATLSASTDYFNIANTAVIESLKSTANEAATRATETAKTLKNLLATQTAEEAKSTEGLAKQSKAKEALYEGLAVSAATSFVSMVASGQNAATAMIGIVIDSAISLLNAMIPTWVAGIFGTTVAQLGPWGLALAGVATATLMGLANLAKSALSGADAGVVGIDDTYNKKPSARDTIPILVRKGEAIINTEAVDANRGLLEFINNTNRPAIDYFKGMGFDSPEMKVIYEGNQNALRDIAVNVTTQPQSTTADTSRVIAAMEAQTDALVKENQILRAENRQHQRALQGRQSPPPPPQPKPAAPQLNLNWS